MRIAIVTSQFYPYIGGAEVYALRLSRELINLGHEVQVFTTDPTRKLVGKDLIQKIPVYRFHSWDPLGNGWCWSPELFKALSNLSGINVIHCHKLDNFPTLAASLLASKCKAPLLITPHLGLRADRKWMHQIYFPTVARWCLSRAQAVCVVSDIENKRLHNLHALVDRQKVETVPLAAPDDLFAIQRTLSNRNDPLKVLFIGRLESSQKGIDRLIHMISSCDDKITFRIAGEGPELVQIKELLQSLPQKIIYWGVVHDDKLAQVYSDSDVLVIPSRLESNPAVVLEAMASGLPVVGSDIPALRAVIRHGFNGYLISEPDNVDKWLSCLETMNRDRHHLSQIGINARSSVSDKTWNVVAQQHVNLYQSLIDKNRSKRRLSD